MDVGPRRFLQWIALSEGWAAKLSEVGVEAVNVPYEPPLISDRYNMDLPLLSFTKRLVFWDTTLDN